MVSPGQQFCGDYHHRPHLALFGVSQHSARAVHIIGSGEVGNLCHYGGIDRSFFEFRLQRARRFEQPLADCLSPRSSAGQCLRSEQRQVGACLARAGEDFDLFVVEECCNPFGGRDIGGVFIRTLYPRVDEF